MKHPMRALVTSLLLMIASSFSLSINAQVKAVMEVRVNIISGAGLNSIEEPIVDLSSASIIGGDIETGSFSLVAAPGSDVQVYVSQESEIRNEKGDIVEFDNFSVDQNSNNKGDHHIKVNGKLKSQQELYNGNYRGAVTAVVEYL